MVGECLVVESDAGMRGLYTTELALLETTATDGAWRRFDPPLKEFQWPLLVSDRWSDAITVTESTGKIQSVQLVAEVVSYESVFVPAGSFLAHRVVITVGGQRFCEVWYAPETKTVVRGITPDAQGREVISELVDYQKGSATGYVDR